MVLGMLIREVILLQNEDRRERYFGEHAEHGREAKLLEDGTFPAYCTSTPSFRLLETPFLEVANSDLCILSFVERQLSFLLQFL